MKKAIPTIILALGLTGCATTFETDRDRVVILGFGFTAGFVSSKTTSAKSETKNEGDSAEEEQDGQRAAGEPNARTRDK